MTQGPTHARTAAWRGPVSVALLVPALILFAAAAVVWTSTWRVVSADRFSQVAIAGLRTDAGKEIVARRIQRQVDRLARSLGVPLPAEVEPAVRQATAVALDHREVEPLLRTTIQAAHAVVVDTPGQTIRIDLAALRPVVEEALAALHPALVRYLPPADQLGAVDITLTDRWPVLARVPAAVNAFRPLPFVAGALGAALMVMAVLLAPRPRRVLLAGGIGLMVVALLPLLLRLIAPPVAEAFVGAGPTRSLASSVAADVLGVWWIATLVPALAGGGMIAAALLTGGGRDPGAPRPA